MERGSGRDEGRGEEVGASGLGTALTRWGRLHAELHRVPIGELAATAVIVCWWSVLGNSYGDCLGLCAPEVTRIAVIRAVVDSFKLPLA